MTLSILQNQMEVGSLADRRLDHKIVKDLNSDNEVRKRMTIHYLVLK